MTTIAARATPPGRGGLGVIRISGPKALAIGRELLRFTPKPRYAHYAPFWHDDEIIDQGIALYFAGPHSFTGEDILELQAHGGPVVLDRLLSRVLALGAEPAGPGAFSERAFLNGKMDLLQVQAVADLIDAASVQAARSAVRTLQGDFSKDIQQFQDALTQCRSYLEAALDFPEEEIDFLSEKGVIANLEQLSRALEKTRQQAGQGVLLQEGLQVVLAGPPNAGKSSLLNYLSGCDAAIVSPQAGTTRDTVSVQIAVEGVAVTLTDTAGLRNSTDHIEQIGMERANKAMMAADIIFFVVDASQAHDAVTDAHALSEQFELEKTVIVRNKCDISGSEAGFSETEQGPVLTVSAKTGAGMAALREYLRVRMGRAPASEGGFMARRRHLHALEKTEQAVSAAREHAKDNCSELVAEELRIAQQALAEMTGKMTADDLLGEIFSQFCIGK